MELISQQFFNLQNAAAMVSPKKLSMVSPRNREKTEKVESSIWLNMREGQGVCLQEPNVAGFNQIRLMSSDHENVRIIYTVVPF